MTPTQEQKRIKIAEACGWTGPFEIGWNGDQDKFGLIGICPDWKDRDVIPDYFNDLNACHEMEKALPRDGIRLSYVEMLAIFQTDHHPFFSTAQERAECFGLTLNLWTPND